MLPFVRFLGGKRPPIKAPHGKSNDQFEREVLSHLDSLYGVAVRLTRDPREAEDLVQETALRAFRFFDRFEEGSNGRAWLFKILHNTFINRYRRRMRDRDLAAELSVNEGVGATISAETAEAAHNPESAILEDLVSDDVRRALERLPPEFRVPVILCDLEELSYKEIADIMDCPVGTVMSRLYRGRRLLQDALREYAMERGIVKRPADVIPFPAAAAPKTER